LIKTVILAIVVIMMQGCSSKSVQKEASTQDVLNKQLYSLIHKLEKRIDNIPTSASSDELFQLKEEITYHEQVLTALIKDVSLLRDEKVSEHKDLYKPVEQVNLTDSRKEQFEAKTFKLTRQSNILDINNDIFAVWEKGTSFTSYVKKADYYQVTGFFTSKKWIKSDRELWISMSDVSER